MANPKTFKLSSLPKQTGKSILITGGTNGIGAETVQQLASLSPARIIFTGRDAHAADELIARIKQAHPHVTVEFLRVDLADLADVAAQVDTLKLDKLDTLILNAGVMALPASTSKDGYEIQFAINHMGHALLSLLLLPTLRKSPDARLVTVSSQAYRGHRGSGVDFDTIKTPQGSGYVAEWIKYAQSKLANIVWAHAIASREPNITAVSIHPGVVYESKLVSKLDWRFTWLINATTFWRQLSLYQGGLNTTWAAAGSSTDVVSGKHYEPVGVETAVDAKANDKDFEKKLWDWTNSELKRYMGQVAT